MRDLAQFDRERSSYFLERSQWDRSGEAAILEPEVADGLSSRIRDYWLIFQKHRRLIGISVLGSVVVCAIVVFFLMTSIYTAETTLLIERNPPQVLALQQELISPEPLVPDEHDFYKTQNEILTSRHLAAEVIHEQHLENSPVLTGSPGPIGWAMTKATWLVN